MGESWRYSVRKVSRRNSLYNNLYKDRATQLYIVSTKTPRRPHTITAPCTAESATRWTGPRPQTSRTFTQGGTSVVTRGAAADGNQSSARCDAGFTLRVITQDLHCLLLLMLTWNGATEAATGHGNPDGIRPPCPKITQYVTVVTTTRRRTQRCDGYGTTAARGANEGLPGARPCVMAA